MINSAVIKVVGLNGDYIVFGLQLLDSDSNEIVQSYIKARTDNYDVDILESIMRAYQVKESRDLIGKSCVVMALEHSDTVIYLGPFAK